MAVSILSYNEILGAMVKKLLADTALSDMRVGSVISTILEAAAQSDFETHASIVQMIQLFSIDTTTGADLDNRASEFNVRRETALASSDFVRLGDKSFTKKSSKLYIGLPPPVVGDTSLNVEDASAFPTTGSVYIGRGTGNYEGPIAYSSLTNNISYWTINLSSPVTRNHTSVENIVLAQGGNRTVNAGIVVRSPANNFSPAVSFVISRAVTLVDGENSIDGVPVVCQVPGTIGNVPAGAIVQFAAAPFSGATVTNLSNFVNGRDIELDAALRARIRNAIQLIARGTKSSILQAVKGVSDTTDNKRVTSAALAEPINATVPAQLYIDDGTGFEPSFAGQGVEKIVDSAAGSEQLIQVSHFPITPPILVSALAQPYAIQPGMNLNIRVDSSQETITFVAGDFKVPGLVKASEIIDAINARATLVTARSANGKTSIALVAKRFFDGTDPEEMQIVSGTANDFIKFPVTVSRVMSLYKDGVLLRKNPASAVVFTNLRTLWSFGSSTIAARLLIAVDGTPQQDIVFRDSDFQAYGVSYKIATAEQWAAVLTAKISGVTVLVEAGKLSFSSNKSNSASSKIIVSLASDLGARAATAAVWRSGMTVRYSVANTAGIVVGDSLVITGFVSGSNNGVFPVTKVAENDYIEVTSGRTDGTNDETGVLTASVNPSKEDLSLVIFGSAVSAVGATSDYNLNRFSGEIELASRLSVDDDVTAGSEFTSAHIDSIPASNSKYNFPVQQDVNPAVLVAIDSPNSAKRTYLIANGDVITQTRIDVDHVQIQSNRSNSFGNVQVGDYVLVATKSVTGAGTDYTQWFPSYATGLFEVTQVINPQTVYLSNPDPTLASVLTGTVSSTDDIQAFYTEGLVQTIALSGVNLLPSDVVNQVNASLFFATAQVFNNRFVRLSSNSLNETISRVYILATSGSGKNLYTAGTSAVATQPHIGFQLAAVEQTSFPRLVDGLTGFLSQGLARSIVFGKTTSPSLTMPYHNIDSTQSYTTSIHISDSIKYQDGLNNQQILGIRSIDSNTQLTPQGYGVIRPIYDGDRYIISESQKFSPADKLIIELDQDPTNKTFLIPMYRTGRVFGTATTTTFDAYDMDSSAGTDFNNSIWRDFSFQDFAVHFRSRNVYKAAAADTAVILRSTVFGAVGDNDRFTIAYPSAPSSAAYAIHTVANDNSQVTFFLASGASRAGISNVGAGYRVTRSGALLTLNYAGVGPSPNFSGNGVMVGDIMSITDPAFSSKSPLLIGSGKVTAVSPTSATIKLPGSGTIATTYTASSATDSNSGFTTTLSMPSTGLLAIGDTVIVSGFSRAINNGTFTVAGVTTDTSIAVAHSNRTTITQATSGYRRTGNTVSLQFAGTVAGQVQVGDSIVVSGMAESTLNGPQTVTAILTTTSASDTIQYTAAGVDLPVARTVTTAIWQSGNTTRYATTNTGGIAIGNTVVITGFANAVNNGTFLVTNVSNNNYIEVTNTRVSSAADETGVTGSARPTYFIVDTAGTVKVLNNETGAATVDLVVVQSVATGMSAFPLAPTTAASMITTINSNPIVSKVITAVNALGFNGTGIITQATFDEPASVGYGHTAGGSYLSLYDGVNWVLDFYSASVNPHRNFSLKKQLQFSSPYYDISTAPNIAGEQPGEYFKLVPTTFRNVNAWFNKSSVTSFSIAGTAAATADGGKLQLASKTIGTAGAVKVTGGSANGIPSYVKIPASIDSGSIRLQVNNSDTSAFIKNAIVKVQNSIASRKANNFIAGDSIDVQSVDGTTARFKAKPRSITLSTANSVTITDVSASYGRTAGIVWRWTMTGSPAAPLTGAKAGDVLVASNTNLNVANRTSTSTGDGAFSQFAILAVDTAGQYVDVHNPYGVAEGPIPLSGTLAVTVSPAFFIQWRHRLDATAVMKVEALEFRNLFKYSWVSGATAPLFAQNGISVDDYVILSGNTFLPENRGTFRVVAVDDAYFVVENEFGLAQATVDVDLVQDVTFLYSESTIAGDKLNVSDLVFLEPNRGANPITNYGTDATLKTQYITLNILASSNQTGVILTGLPNTFFVTDGLFFSSYRHITNFAVDPSDVQSAIVYLKPAMNSKKMSNSFNTSITPIQKLSFSSDAAIGVDGYRYYTGLLATVQKVVDGYDPDPVNFSGYKAAGTQIETVPPLQKNVFVNIIVKPSGGIALSALSDAIKASILNYINGLGVGESVIISEITSAVMSVEGVMSSTLFDPPPTQESIVLQDNQKAVINIDNITVSSG